MKAYALGLLFGILIISTPGYVWAQTGELAEVINDFTTEVEVQKDGTIHVKETIVYDFRQQNRRGIIRDIPLTDSPGTFDRMSVENIQVTNERSLPYDFEVTGDTSPLWGKVFGGLALENETVTVKVGNSHTPVRGVRTYVVSYDVKNAVGYFDDRAEIYWNATGHEWLVPIESSRTVVTLPGNQTEFLIPASYCGIVGSKTPCDSAAATYNESKDVTTVTITSPRSLIAGEGITVAVGFPKNTVDTPGLKDMFFHYLLLFWGFLLLPIITLWWFRDALRHGLKRRRFYQSRPIVAEYTAGEYDPLQTSCLFHGDVRTKDIPAQIIHLARLGYLVIKKIDKGYLFERTDKDATTLPKHSQTLLSVVGNDSTISLRFTFFRYTAQIVEEVVASLKDRGLLVGKKRGNPYTVFGLSMFLAINPGVFIWVLLGTQAAIVFSGSCLLIALVSIVFRPRARILTEEGLEAERLVRGLREYVDVAEEERINFHNAPEKSPELFETLLPYAMVMGLEKKWAAEFSDIYTTPPTWYSSGTLDAFTAQSFLSDIDSFKRSTSLATAVRTSSGSSFGSSGSNSGSSSGFSGGGGGGGGGRSW